MVRLKKFACFLLVFFTGLACVERQNFRTGAAKKTPPTHGATPGESENAPKKKAAEEKANETKASPQLEPVEPINPDNNPTPAQPFRIVGYQPSWAGTAAAIPYDKLTHIIYAFLLPTEGGGYKPLEAPDKLRAIVSRAHAMNPPVRVLLAIGGWGGSAAGHNSILKAFQNMVSNQSLGDGFIAKLMALVEQYNLDGIDLDWEYPRVKQDGPGLGNFVQRLGEKLHAKGKLLSAAVYAAGDSGAGILSSSFPHYDFLNLMSYDNGATGPHASMDYARKAIEYWRNRGLPKEKINLGVPFYARPTSASLKWNFSVAYSKLVSLNVDNQWRDSTSYWQGGKAVTVDYNGRNTMKDKSLLAKGAAGGIMIWELSHDSQGESSLLTTIEQSLGGVHE